MRTCDLAIVGSGFGGSLLAMIARRLGRSVLLLERGAHPRFAIGESSTPLANLLLEEISDAYDLPRVRPLSKWGTWQRTYPHIACGRKRGFSFFHHAPGQAIATDDDHRALLLVGANPTNELADTHWYRPQFDQFLASEAQAAGATYFDRVELNGIEAKDGRWRLRGLRPGEPLDFTARVVIDGTGPRGFLHRQLQLGEIPFPNLPRTQALFSHFRGVRPLADAGLIRAGETPPYPIDEAAVHHVFDGGWVWVLPFNNGVTSAGIAVTDQFAAALNLNDGPAAWQRLQQHYPVLGVQFRDAEAILPFQRIPRLGFQSAAIAGEGWALLPSAAGFVDPLLSTGFSLTLLGVQRLGRLIETRWGQREFQNGLEDYAAQTRRELLAVEQLVAALYASMRDFPSFVALTSLYFAPVSFSEIAHRLGRGELAQSFLLCDEPGFGPECSALLAEALALLDRGCVLSDDGALLERIRALAARVDVIGLSKPGRKNWHPASDAELLEAAPKLGVTRAEMERFLGAPARLP